MATERKQLNTRVDETTEAAIERLKPAMTAAIGVTITVTDIVRLGVAELAKKYLTEGEAAGRDKAELPPFPWAT